MGFLNVAGSILSSSAKHSAESRASFLKDVKRSHPKMSSEKRTQLEMQQQEYERAMEKISDLGDWLKNR